MNKENVLAKFWQAPLPSHQGKLIDADNQFEISYPELNLQIESFAKRITKTRQLVALIADNSLAFVVAYLALLRHQHVILLIEDSLLNDQTFELSEQNKKLLEQYPVNYLVCGKDIIALNQSTIKLHPELALLLSTSGSTGSSKLVKISYANLAANTHSICNYLPIKSSDTVVTTLPLHYSFGLSVLNTHLALGASIVLTNATPLDKALWQIYKDFQPQSFYGVPFSFELLNKLQLKRLPLDSILYFAQAGGRISAENAQTINKWCDKNHQQLFLMYGQTEATARIAYLSPEKSDSKAQCIGQAIPNGKLCLVDNNGNSIKESNVEGELCYQGDNVFKGYATDINCLAFIETIDWLATGDIAVFDDEGDFKITGRSKRIIKVVGKRISLDEVEQHLLHECDKHQISNVAIAVSGKDELLTINFDGYNIDKTNVEKKLNELTQKLTHINARYIKLNYHQKLPRLNNGKIAYKQLND